MLPHLHTAQKSSMQGSSIQGSSMQGSVIQVSNDNPFNPIPFCCQLKCPHCRNTYDRSKMVFSLNIRQYTCLMCRNNILQTV